MRRGAGRGVTTAAGGSSNWRAREGSGRGGGGGAARWNFGRPPRGLRGRDIGMFYARKSKERKEQLDEITTPVLNLSRDQLARLHSCAAAFGAPQPEFAATFNESEASSTGASWGRYFHKSETFNSDCLNQMREQRKSPLYERLLNQRRQLPVHRHCSEILNCVNENQVTIVCGETGSGKSTQVPQFILDAAIESHSASSTLIVCTQPRRISATSLAERVAQERGQSQISHDGSVGYQIRLQERLPRARGSLVFCTTGILLQWMSGNVDVPHISHVILDEVHERDVLCDFLLILLRDLLPRRPELKLILMSATLDAEHFARYLHVNDDQIIQIPGRQHHVHAHYLEQVLAITMSRSGVAASTNTRTFPPKRHRGKRHKFDNNDRNLMEQKAHEHAGWLADVSRTHGHDVADRLEELENMDARAFENTVNELVVRLVLSIPPCGILGAHQLDIE